MTAGFAAAIVLFAQLAMATHACAAFVASGANVSMAAMNTGSGDTPCADMDPGQQNVWLQHCQSGMQSVDHTPAPVGVPPAGPLYQVDQPDLFAASLQATQRYSHALLARVTAPPLSVRKCCLRI